MLHVKCEVNVKKTPDKQKVREFDVSSSALEEIQKRVLQATVKRY